MHEKDLSGQNTADPSFLVSQSLNVKFPNAFSKSC